MERETGKVLIEVDKQLAERILKQIEYRENVQNNIKSFWQKKGVSLIEHYYELLRVPTHRNITEAKFRQQLRECQVLIISANSVEGTIISRRLIKSAEITELDAFPYEGHLFQFASIEGISVCHIWPSDTSSFTQYGSFSALEAALEITKPKYVMSVGVAFGIDPNNQNLGDVLISKELVFYDHFNKVTDGVISLNPHEVFRIDANLTSQLHALENETPPKEVGDFKWHYKAILTGGTVLSDAEEKDKLVNAASGIGYKIAGGEMEASGIYYACQKRKNRKIPFIIVKGICDWGAEKNGWNEVVETQHKGDTIKDCVQAFACDNAFSTMRFVLKQLNFYSSANSNQAGSATKRKIGGLKSNLKDMRALKVPYINEYNVKLKEVVVDKVSGCSFIINNIYQVIESVSITVFIGDRKQKKRIAFKKGAHLDIYDDNRYSIILSSIIDDSHCIIIVKRDN